MEKTPVTIRKFGVENPDAYWQQRKDQNRVAEGRLHRFISDLVDKIAPERGGNVLDCGVGSGRVLRLCAQKHDVYGVEVSAEAIAMCDSPQENIKQADLNEGIPEFGVKFDVIVASMILHWLDDPLAFLCQARQMLSERGCVLAAIPNITYYRYRLGYLFGKFPPISLSHKNFQAPAEAQTMFAKAGYEVKKRLSPKRSIGAMLLPTLFSQNIVYVLRPS